MAEAAMLTIQAVASAELVEKKSRFIGTISPVADEQAAQEFLAAIRRRDKEASHHVYAWQIGADNQIQRSNDDGEPSGTAGRPLLEAIKKAGLQNTALVVSRYFGGVLLGAGGLTRAYAKTAQLAIQAAEPVRLIPARKDALSFAYPLVGKLEALLAQQGYPLLERIFAAEVCFLCLIPCAEWAAAQKLFAEASGGALHWQELSAEEVIAAPAT